MSERGRELDHASCIGALVVQFLHRSFDFLLACSQDNSLTLILLRDFGNGREKDVDTFLLLQASDESDDWDVVLHVQAQLSLKSLLRRRFAFHDTRRAVVGGEVLVDGRVPVVRVHAVDDALDATVLLNHTVKLNTSRFVQHHFLSVVRTHGDVLVGRDEPGLHPVELLVRFAGVVHVLLGLVGRHCLVKNFRKTVFKGELAFGGFRQRQALPVRIPESPLERDVVHAKCHLCVCEFPSRFVDVSDEHGDKCRVPVVRDEGSRLSVRERQYPRRLDGRLTEDSEPFLVV
mmetsp:Transcript_12403/g.31496  ORF Transcript_12403/g.31496 Transcript_12403/m.31496 type:complete len:289 (-) Transcript_12403:661-1527(-)